MANDQEAPPAEPPVSDSRQNALRELCLTGGALIIVPQLAMLAAAMDGPAPAAPAAGSLAHLVLLLGQACILALVLRPGLPGDPAPRGWFRASPARFLAALPYAALLIGAAFAVGLIAPGAQPQAVAPAAPAPAAALRYLAVMLFAVACEEALYRVWLVSRLESFGVTPVAAALVSAALFASAHGAQGLPGVAIAAAGGLVLALAWLRGRNFWTVFSAHALYNLIVLAGLWLAPRG